MGDLHFDLVHNLWPVVALNPASITSDTTTTGRTLNRLAVQPFTGGPLFVVLLGALADIAGAFQLFHDDDSGMATEAAVPDDALMGNLEADVSFTEADTSATNSAASKAGSIQYRGSKQYLRCKIVSTSTSGANLLAILALFGLPTTAPITPPKFT